jgi:hypothetical protein
MSSAELHNGSTWRRWESEESTHSHSNRIRQQRHRRNHSRNLPAQPHRHRLIPLRPKQIKEKRAAKDRRYENAHEDVEARDPNEIVIVHITSRIEVLDAVLLLVEPRDGVGADGFADDAEDHGDLVDDHFCPAQVVGRVEHVGGFEFGPLHFGEVEAPDCGCHSGDVLV